MNLSPLPQTIRTLITPTDTYGCMLLIIVLGDSLDPELRQRISIVLSTN